jgi:DNA-binding PadR family transcriptional regulator
VVAGDATAWSGRVGEVLRILASEPSLPHFAGDISAATGLSSGDVAIALSRMERQAWLRSGWEDIDPEVWGRPQRRAYRLTSLGRTEVGTRADAPGPPLPAPAGRREDARLAPGYRTSLAATLCDLAADALAPDVRERYRSEWRADLAADPAQSLTHAVSIVAHLRLITAAITGRDVTDLPWACRLHWHRYVTIHDNLEDWRSVSHLCTRCGHITDDWRGARRTADSLAWATFSRGNS